LVLDDLKAELFESRPCSIPLLVPVSRARFLGRRAIAAVHDLVKDLKPPVYCRVREVSVRFRTAGDFSME